METAVVQSSSFIDGTRPVVECAGKIADDVVLLLDQNKRVVLSVRGVRGVSSSFFNVILSRIRDAVGARIEPTRFTVDTDTQTQRLIFERSMKAFFPDQDSGASAS